MIDPTAPDDRDIRVLGPSGYSVLAHLIQTDAANFGQQRVATYEIDAPGGTWNRSDNGHYLVYLRPNQILDNHSRPVPAQILGGFRVHIPRTQTTAATLIRASFPTIAQQKRHKNDPSDLLS